MISGTIFLTKMKKIVLHAEQTTDSVATTRTLHLECPDGKTHTVFFRCHGERLPEPRVMDGFVVGTLLYAMGVGADLHVRGAVTHRLLRNLQEYQGAWHSWFPDRYQFVEIVPDRIAESLPEDSTRTAVSAFSGGIDSTFTVWRHNNALSENVSYPVKDALLFHGFDIHLNHGKDFQLLVERVQPRLERMGIRLHTVSTNLKELELMPWKYSFSAQMAACLHQYSHAFQYALLAGSEPFRALILPGGSNPVIDPLFSGGEMTLIHDGAGYSRTEKLEMLVKAEAPLDSLRVCWEGKRQDRNCGRCEKCIRTHLSFLSLGIVQAECFDEPLRISDLKSLVLMDHVQHAQLSSVYQSAVAHGHEQEEWAAVVKKLLKNFRTPNAAQSLLLRVKRRARRLLIRY